MVDEIALEVPERCLAFYVDDTGHEALASGHPVYALGGCAVLGRDMERLLTQPWREVRKRVTGSPDTPLHANKFGNKAEHIEAVVEFFRLQAFFRFAAVLTDQTTLADELSIIRTMKEVLQRRIVEIAERTLCKEVKIIFESSERADPIVEGAFQDLEVRRGSKLIPSECYFMRKSFGESALEVADFVMHAVGRQIRYGAKRPGGFVPDFSAVFHSVDRRFTSYMHLKEVTYQPPSPPSGAAQTSD
jgi:hypothetical protein